MSFQTEHWWSLTVNDHYDNSMFGEVPSLSEYSAKMPVRDY